MRIQIPEWATIQNYRTMTAEKKGLVVAGSKLAQWFTKNERL